MNTDLHTIKAAGKKEVPDGTKIHLSVGTLSATAKVKIQLPGQKDFTDLGDNLPIYNGLIGGTATFIKS